MIRFLFIASLLLPIHAIAAANPPNFIFILSDDIAQGDLGCYGQELIQTPRLDRMAAEGTRHMQAYCGTSVCAPSRASFFTGLHSGHCPIRGNWEVAPEGQLPLPAATVTIAEVAKFAGYATATFGKWGMGFFGTSGDPHKQGIDHFFGYNCQRHAHSHFPTYLYDNDQPFLLPGNDGQGVGETYAQQLIQNDMIRWLKANAGKPFFLFYAITLPHARHEIDDFGIYKDKPWSDREKAYAAQVTRIDSDVGELLDALRELGIDRNTLVIFTGDNGSSFPADSEIGKRFNQAGNGLRGFKRGLYEGALRQAAITWWPGTVPAGRVDDQPWAFWDLMPTFVKMSGAKPPQGYETDGLPLLEYLKGGEVPRRDYFYWELHESGRPIQAARFGNWKAVRNGTDKPTEIYDLDADAAEANDLAATRPDLVERAAKIFADAHRADPHWPLDHLSEALSKSREEAWKTKTWRDKTQWVPENAKPIP
jgi:arylsulfatase A